MKKHIRRKITLICLIAVSLAIVVTSTSCGRFDAEDFASKVIGMLADKSDESDESADSADNAEEWEEIRVSSTAEFLRAIGSNRVIILEEGEYALPDDDGMAVQGNLTDWEIIPPGTENPAVAWEQHGGYAGLTIRGVENLRIEGEPVNFGRSTAFFKSPSQFLDCLIFRDCANIELAFFELASTSESDSVIGSILAFRDCENVTLTGIAVDAARNKTGLHLNNVSNFTAENSYIGSSLMNMMYCYKVTNAEFSNCRIEENERSINIFDSSNFTFSGCYFGNNIGEDYTIGLSDPLFSCTNADEVIVRDCEFANNVYMTLDKSGTVVFENLILDESNLFEHIPDLFVFSDDGRLIIPESNEFLADVPEFANGDPELADDLPDEDSEPAFSYGEDYAISIVSQIADGEGLSYMIDEMTVVELEDHMEDALVVRVFYDHEEHIETVGWYYVGAATGRVWEYSVVYDALVEIYFS